MVLKEEPEALKKESGGCRRIAEATRILKARDVQANQETNTD
jgi:hypothetical protein